MIVSMAKQRHPLKVSFAEYLSTLSAEQVNARLGTDRADAWRNGRLDTTRYVSPPSHNGFTMHDMKERDIIAFRRFHHDIKVSDKAGNNSNQT